MLEVGGSMLDGSLCGIARGRRSVINSKRLSLSLAGSAVKIVVKVACAVRRETVELLAGNLPPERLNLLPNSLGPLRLAFALRCSRRCGMCGLPNRHSN